MAWLTASGLSHFNNNKFWMWTDFVRWQVQTCVFDGFSCYFRPKLRVTWYFQLHQLAGMITMNAPFMNARHDGIIISMGWIGLYQSNWNLPDSVELEALFQFLSAWHNPTKTLQNPTTGFLGIKKCATPFVWHRGKKFVANKVIEIATILIKIKCN